MSTSTQIIDFLLDHAGATIGDLNLTHEGQIALQSLLRQGVVMAHDGQLFVVPEPVE